METARTKALKEVLRLREAMRKDPAVQDLEANSKKAKTVFQRLYEGGKRSLYAMFRTLYKYRWTGLKAATLALIAYLAWAYFSSPTRMSKALVPYHASSKALAPTSKALVPASKALAPYRAVSKALAPYRAVSTSAMLGLPPRKPRRS